MTASMSYVSDLWHHRELLWHWTLREVNVRYKQTVLGISWAVFQPAVLALVYSVVFSLILQVPTGDVPYPLFAYTALVPWTFFANSLGQGIPSLVGQMNLITKAAFPREILPFGVLGATFVDFLCAFVVFVVMLVVYGAPLTLNVLWLPLLLLLQMALSAAVILAGSALNVFFRDIRFIVPLMIQIWMYASPVIYPTTLVPEWLLPLYNLNPMVGIIQSYRSIFLYGLAPSWSALLPGFLITVILLVAAYLFFKRVEPNFADII